MVLKDVPAIYLGDTPVERLYLSEDIVWPVDLINPAITSDYAIGAPIKDVDEIAPYGYYAMRWDKDGTYGVLTRELEDYYVTDRYLSTFIDANVDNGVIHSADARKIRILQAVPKAAVMSGGTLYAEDTQGNDYVYTGASYLLYDIYVDKYFSWKGVVGVEHMDISEFAGRPTYAPLIWNYLNASADGNRIAMRSADVNSSGGAWLPYKRVLDGINCMDGVQQFANWTSPRIDDWDDVKISIIPLTPVA